jgi:hypothetical protein
VCVCCVVFEGTLLCERIVLTTVFLTANTDTAALVAEACSLLMDIHGACLSAVVQWITLIGMHTHSHTYTYIHIHIHTCRHVYMHAHIHACIHTYARTHARTQLSDRMQSNKVTLS